MGVAKDATTKEIQRAYRLKSRKLHPDKNPDDPLALEKFQRLNHIQKILTEPAKRSHYDRFGEADIDEVDSGSEPEAEEDSCEEDKEMTEEAYKELLNQFKSRASNNRSSMYPYIQILEIINLYKLINY